MRSTYWTEHPDYPQWQWRYEVANGDTLEGYHEWVASTAQGADELAEENDDASSQ